MTTVINADQSRREQKKTVVRERIIARAIDLFSRRGIADVTVDQIAEAADVGKGTIYNYFETKEDIVVAFMVELERRVQAKLKTLTRSRQPQDAILAGFILHQFQMKQRYHQFVRILLGQMFLRTEEFLPYVAEMQKAIDPPLENLLRSLQRRGAIRSDVHLPELLKVFKTIQLGLTALWAIEGPSFRKTEPTVKLEMMLFCKGLGVAT